MKINGKSLGEISENITFVKTKYNYKLIHESINIK